MTQPPERPSFATGGGALRMLLHLPNFIRLYSRLWRDPRVSLIPKAVLAAGIAYFIIPTDLLPDFPLIGLGHVDDIAVLIGALRLFISLCPRSVVEEHVQLIDQGG